MAEIFPTALKPTLRQENPEWFPRNPHPDFGECAPGVFRFFEADGMVHEADSVTRICTCGVGACDHLENADAADLLARICDLADFIGEKIDWRNRGPSLHAYRLFLDCVMGIRMHRALPLLEENADGRGGMERASEAGQHTCAVDFWE